MSKTKKDLQKQIDELDKRIKVLEGVGNAPAPNVRFPIYPEPYVPSPIQYAYRCPVCYMINPPSGHFHIT